MGKEKIKVIISGGTGFIGSALVKRLLSESYQVVVLTRGANVVDNSEQDPPIKAFWDGESIGPWLNFVEGADAVINLSGVNIAEKRWSKSRKRFLIDSRINSTRAIVKAISEVTNKPKTLINASAIGYYGSFGEGDVSEEQHQGVGFLADLCKGWEYEAIQAEKYGLRVVLLRTGIVLGISGGALKKMILPFNMFIGGSLGSGKQWISWVHRDDVINVILFILKNDSVKGAVNVVSPSPVTMDEFALLLGKTINRPSWLRVPSFMVKLVLGEMSEMLLGGRRIIPKKLLESGFEFQYTDLADSLGEIFNKFR